MILGVIPARGGSKGIPRKNIKTIAGQPLIAWTIAAAQAAQLLDRVVISTEDEEIARIAQQYKIEVLSRPAELASDDASTLSVLQHAVQKISCDTVVLLQVTSPIRSAGLIDDCIREFQDAQYDSLATGWMCHYTEYGTNDLRRQDIPGFFYDDGNIYVIRADLIKEGDRYGRKIGRKIVSRQENVEIDDDFDFWLVEKILMERDL